MGTKADARRRENIRIDTVQRRSWVERARKWIFEDGKGVLSSAVERAMGPTSLVPTRVCAL